MDEALIFWSIFLSMIAIIVTAVRARRRANKAIRKAEELIELAVRQFDHSKSVTELVKSISAEIDSQNERIMDIESFCNGLGSTLAGMAAAYAQRRDAAGSQQPATYTVDIVK